MTLSKTNPEQIFFTVDAGFVGSHFILDWLDTSDEGIINFAADSRIDRSIRGTYHFPEKLTPLVIHNAKITVEIETGGLSGCISQACPQGCARLAQSVKEYLTRRLAACPGAAAAETNRSAGVKTCFCI